MELVLCIILIVLGVLNLSVGMLAYARENDKTKANRTFFYIGVGGTLWCFGYALMGISNNVVSAYLLRAVALFGVFFSLGYIIKYVQLLSGIRFRYQRLFDNYKIVGGFLCNILVAIPLAVRFVDTPYGKSYISNPWIGRYIQYLYLFTMAVAWFYSGIVWYKRAIYKREKAMSRNIITSGVILCIGMVFDTIVPILGTAAFPSSAISTFFFILMLYKSLKLYNDLSISSQTVANSIFKNVSVPVAVLNNSMVIIDCNEQASDFFQETRNVLLDTPLRKLMVHISDKVIEDIRAEVFNESDRYEFEATVKVNNNICTVVLSPIYDRFGQILCIIAIFHDITQNILIQRNIEKVKHMSELANAARHAFFKGVDQVLVNTAEHNIDYCEKLIESAKVSMTETDTEYAKDGAMVEVSYRQLLGLRQENEMLKERLSNMNDIALMESRQYELEKQKYDIGKLLSEVICSVAEKIDESRVKFVTEISPSIPRILIGDEKRLKQVLSTMLNNSVRFTRQGIIKLRLTYKIRFGVVTLLFDISDTGVGMLEQDIEAIFGDFDKGMVPMNRNLSSDVGTGLGMTICRNIVKLFNGEMSVKSALNHGTTFSFSVEQKTDSEHAIVPYGDYKQRVIFMEEGTLYVDAVSRIFKELGIECKSLSGTIEDDELPLDEKVTMIIVSADLLGRFREILESKYAEAKIYPIYSYQNYKKLKASQEGVCGPLLFQQVAELIK